MIVDAEKIKEYLETSSDYAFEVRTLKLLKCLGLKVEHGGTYSDPVTSLPREFDFRAYYAGQTSRANLAIECKNLSSDNPLLIHRSPRMESESYIDEIHHYLQHEKYARFQVKRRSCSNSPYAVSEMVGKSCEQISVNKNKNNGFNSSDSGIYNKWSQALASADGLLIALGAASGLKLKDVGLVTGHLFPVVVVPDGMMWTIDYDADGCVLGDPKKSVACEYFVGKQYSLTEQDGRKLDFSVSHIHFVTLSKLEHLISRLIGANIS